MNACNRLGYHSVHLPELPSSEVTRWVGCGSVALTHDLVKEALPPEFDNCDVLYTDLPWRTGFDRYNARADKADGRTYKEFLGAVGQRVGELGKPTVLVTGKHAMPYLPRPLSITPAPLPVSGGDVALALIYGIDLKGGWRTSRELLAHLAASFRRVGDFCCGYGWAAKAFVETGGTFVASDYNPRCIGYIAEHHSEWFVTTHDKTFTERTPDDAS